jgi:hypothetical protein
MTDMLDFKMLAMSNFCFVYIRPLIGRKTDRFKNSARIGLIGRFRQKIPDKALAPLASFQ